MIQAGDLLLFPVDKTSSWKSKLIAWGQKVIGQAPSKKGYSHVAIASWSIGMMIEAYWPRIRFSPLRFPVEVYRVKGITEEQQSQIVRYASNQVGNLYDLLAILSFGKLQVGGTEVCSQLAYNAALAAGIVLCPPEMLESPDDIAASDKLEPIETLGSASQSK